MQILELTVQQFRRFEQPVSLKGLTPGMNIIAGPNEAGKSTLAQAIRAAFFERHSTGSGPLKGLLPWGDSAAAPEIEIQFQIANQPYKLHKRFFKARRCFLDFADRRLEGDEAEQHLAQLLGYDYANRGASDQRNWGVPGLLWIEQGQGQALRDAVLAAGGSLQQALGQQVAELGSSDGEELIELVRQELLTLRTEVQASPKGEWLAGLRQQTELEQSLAAGREQLQHYQQGVDDLSRLQQTVHRLEKEQPWVQLHAQQQQAEAKLKQAQALLTQQEGLQQQLDVLVLNADRLRDWLHVQQDKQQALSDKYTQLGVLRDSLPELRKQRDHSQQRHQEAVKQRDQYEAYREQARQWQLWQAQMASHQAAQQDLERLRSDLNEAEQLEQQIAQLSTASRQEPINAETISRVKAYLSALQRGQAQLEAQAPELQFELNEQANVHLGQERLQGQGSRLLSHEVVLDLGEAGSLRIVPAANQSLGQLHTTIRTQQQELDALLLSLKADGLDALEQRWEQQQERKRDLQHYQAMLQRHAPHGLLALRQHVEALSAQQGLAPEKPVIAPVQDVDFEQPDMLEQEYQSRKRSAHALEQEWRPLRDQVQEQEQILRTLESDYAALKEQLDKHDYQQELREKQAQCKALDEQERSVKAQIAACAEQYRAAGADLLEQDIARYARSALEQRKDYEHSREQLLVLQTRLETQGIQGLEEKIAEQQGRLEQVQKRVAHFERRAAALQLLLDTLQAKRKELSDTLLQPLQARMAYYLRFLPRASAVILDEQFAPTGLRREAQPGLADVVEDLSFGTREQLGLIARLAYADLLQEAGHPTFLMLDDVLLHSDEQRLDDMKRMLTDAAQRHQIVLFTCQEEKWRDMGVRIQRLPQALQ